MVDAVMCLAGNADHEVVPARPAVATGDEAASQPVTVLGGSREARTVLGPALHTRGAQARGRPVEHHHGSLAQPGVALRVLARHPDREVGEPVAIEVGGSERMPEGVEVLLAAGHAGARLAPQLVAVGRETRVGAVEDVDAAAPVAGVDTARDVLLRSARREVPSTVAVEIRDREGGPEPTQDVAAVLDALGGLAPEDAGGID